MRVFFTGGSGKAGRHAIRHLVEQGHRVVLIDAELNDVDGMLLHTNQALELFPNQAPLWFYNGVGYMLAKQPACESAMAPEDFGRRRNAWITITLT